MHYVVGSLKQDRDNVLSEPMLGAVLQVFTDLYNSRWENDNSISPVFVDYENLIICIFTIVIVSPPPATAIVKLLIESDGSLPPEYCALLLHNG